MVTFFSVGYLDLHFKFPASENHIKILPCQIRIPKKKIPVEHFLKFFISTLDNFKFDLCKMMNKNFCYVLGSADISITKFTLVSINSFHIKKNSHCFVNNNQAL